MSQDEDETILQVCVGRPRLTQWRGRTVSTAIVKTPVEGPVRVGWENLEGDQQADRSVHGGPDKAIYAYPAAHYDAWLAELPDLEPPPFGGFGENLTVSGPLDGDVLIGDRFRAGTALLEASHPRLPCFKLNARFGRPDMIKRMIANLRFGYYLRVIETGQLAAGDRFVRVERPEPSRAVTVTEAARAMAIDRDAAALIERAAATPALPGEWKQELNARLERLKTPPPGSPG